MLSKVNIGRLEQLEQMEHTDLLEEGLREEDRVGTGIDRPLELTSASLFERGTVFTKNRRINVHKDQYIVLLMLP